MASKVTGASLTDIYDRLKDMPRHHPLNAETFSDWSMEAGDTIKVTRDGKEYTSPVHSSTMVWKGKTPQITVNSTGNEKRDALTKVSRQKFGRGGGAIRTAGRQFHFEVNQEHLWYEVMDENGKVSRLNVDVNGLNHEVFDADGKVSILQNTTKGLYNEVYDEKTGLKTTLETHAGAFSVLCENVKGSGKDARLKPASIQAGIDAATGKSKIQLNANHVEISGDAIILDGTTTLNSVMTVRNKSIYMNVPLGVNGTITATELELRTGGSGVSITDTELVGMIKSASVSGNVLTLTPVRGNPITFSKATTLSGAWSGGTYTVTAKQNNIEVATNSTRLRALTINGSISKSGKFVSRSYKVQYGPDEDHLYDTGFAATVSLDATSVYNDGYSDGYSQGQASYISRLLRCTSVEQEYPGSLNHIYTFTIEGNFNFHANTNYTFYRTAW